MDKNYRNNLQDKRLEKIEGHIEVINGEMGDVKKDLAIVKTDVSWLVRFFWIIAGASVSGLIVGLFNLILK